MKPFTGALADPYAFPVPSLDMECNVLSDDNIPQVVNSVATIRFFPEYEGKGKRSGKGNKPLRYTLPLQTLSMHLPVSQFKPSAFSSVIMRIKDGDDVFTVLFFSSGKVVFVRCKSPNHSAVVSHQVRLMLNDIPILIHDDSVPGGIRMDTLGKHLDLLNWRVQNVVMSGNLGFRIKLEELAAAAPECIKYTPGGFPGAEGLIRIKSLDQCKCTAHSKCGCKVKVLFFDSGNVIIAGPKHVRDGNYVYHTLRQSMLAFRDDGAVTNRDDRYDDRIKRLADFLKKHAETLNVPEATTKRKKHKTTKDIFDDDDDDDDDNDDDNENDDDDDNVDKHDDDDDVAPISSDDKDTLSPEEEDEALRAAIDDAVGILLNSKNYQARYRNILNDNNNDNVYPLNVKQKRAENETNGVTLLMQACDKGLEETVHMLVESNMENVMATDADGFTAFDRMKNAGYDESNRIVFYLLKKMRK